MVSNGGEGGTGSEAGGDGGDSEENDSRDEKMGQKKMFESNTNYARRTSTRGGARSCSGTTL